MMPTVQDDLIQYGAKAVSFGLVAGTGGSISARDPQQMLWMKPGGFALDELTVADLCGVHLATGKQTKGRHVTTSDVALHVAIYRVRSEVNAVFHVHPPWLSGMISAGVPFQPLVYGAVLHLGRVTTVHEVGPSGEDLAQRVGELARDHETLLMPQHGMLAVGRTVREAYHRCLTAEHAAQSVIAAAAVGRPQYLTEEQIANARASR